MQPTPSAPLPRLPRLGLARASSLPSHGELPQSAEKPTPLHPSNSFPSVESLHQSELSGTTSTTRSRSPLSGHVSPGSNHALTKSNPAPSRNMASPLDDSDENLMWQDELTDSVPSKPSDSALTTANSTFRTNGSKLSETGPNPSKLSQRQKFSSVEFDRLLRSLSCDSDTDTELPEGAPSPGPTVSVEASSVLPSLELSVPASLSHAGAEPPIVSSSAHNRILSAYSGTNTTALSGTPTNGDSASMGSCFSSIEDPEHQGFLSPSHTPSVPSHHLTHPSSKPTSPTSPRLHGTLPASRLPNGPLSPSLHAHSNLSPSTGSRLARPGGAVASPLPPPNLHGPVHPPSTSFHLPQRPPLPTTLLSPITVSAPSTPQPMVPVLPAITASPVVEVSLPKPAPVRDTQVSPSPRATSRLLGGGLPASSVSTRASSIAGSELLQPSESSVASSNGGHQGDSVNASPTSSSPSSAFARVHGKSITPRPTNVSITEVTAKVTASHHPRIPEPSTVVNSTTPLLTPAAAPPTTQTDTPDSRQPEPSKSHVSASQVSHAAAPPVLTAPSAVPEPHPPAPSPRKHHDPREGPPASVSCDVCAVTAAPAADLTLLDSPAARAVLGNSDVMPLILSFETVYELLVLRQVSKRWQTYAEEAIKRRSHVDFGVFFHLVGVPNYTANLQSLLSRFRVITHLSFAYCNRLTDPTFQQLMAPTVQTHNQNLQGLSLFYCTALLDGTLRFIVDGFPKLQELDLSWCIDLSDSAIEYLLSKSKHLKRLRMAHLKSVTSACLTAVRGASSLSYLDLEGCSIDQAAVDELVRDCPQLKVIAPNSRRARPVQQSK